MQVSELVFETERLYIRQYGISEYANFFLLNGDVEVMRYIRPPQSPDEAQLFFQKVIRSYEDLPGTGRWSMHAKNNHQFIGSFAIIPIPDMPGQQLGYALLKEFWGRGYASESVAGGIHYAFDELGLDHIAAMTYPANTASQKVLTKNGFTYTSQVLQEGIALNHYSLQKSIR